LNKNCQPYPALSLFVYFPKRVKQRKVRGRHIYVSDVNGQSFAMTEV
jgi:hypothetical protein